MDRLIKRIQNAILELDLGISTTRLSSDFLWAVNTALRQTGGAPIDSLDQPGVLLRTALSLEAQV